MHDLSPVENSSLVILLSLNIAAMHTGLSQSFLQRTANVAVMLGQCGGEWAAITTKSIATHASSLELLRALHSDALPFKHFLGDLGIIIPRITELIYEKKERSYFLCMKPDFPNDTALAHWAGSAWLVLLHTN